MFDLPNRIKTDHTFSSASAVSLRGLAERLRGGEIDGWRPPWDVPRRKMQLVRGPSRAQGRRPYLTP
jgi:hypothetical protein